MNTRGGRRRKGTIAFLLIIIYLFFPLSSCNLFITFIDDIVIGSPTHIPAEATPEIPPERTPETPESTPDPTATPGFAKTYGMACNEYGAGVFQTSDTGYLITGNTDSTGAGSADFLVAKLDSEGNTIEWQKAYGGSSSDAASYNIFPTTDSGYIFFGGTESFSLGERDFMINKVDGAGNLLWSNSYGGSYLEYANFFEQTKDGGYVAGGTSNSFSGDCFFEGVVYKIDNSGAIVWQKRYYTATGVQCNSLYDLKETADAGFIAAGNYYADYYSINYEVWALKLNSDGTVAWDVTYCGTNNESISKVGVTSDNCYILGGYTNTFGMGDNDILLMKLDSNGSILWQKTYGTPLADNLVNLRVLSDDSIIACGYTVTEGSGTYDIFVLKLDVNGSVEWQKTYGGAGDDVAYKIIPTTGGGYIFIAYTKSYGVGGGYTDIWLVKINDDGDPLGTTSSFVESTPIFTDCPQSCNVANTSMSPISRSPVETNLNLEINTQYP